MALPGHREPSPHGPGLVAIGLLFAALYFAVTFLMPKLLAH